MKAIRILGGCVLATLLILLFLDGLPAAYYAWLSDTPREGPSGILPLAAPALMGYAVVTVVNFAPTGFVMMALEKMGAWRIMAIVGLAIMVILGLALSPGMMQIAAAGDQSTIQTAGAMIFGFGQEVAARYFATVAFFWLIHLPVAMLCTAMLDRTYSGGAM